MGQGTGPQFEHLYPEGLGSRGYGPVGKWGYNPSPEAFRVTSEPRGRARAGACLTRTGLHSLGPSVPWKLPMASTGVGEIQAGVIFKCLTTVKLKYPPKVLNVSHVFVRYTVPIASAANPAAGPTHCPPHQPAFLSTCSSDVALRSFLGHSCPQINNAHV